MSDDPVVAVEPTTVDRAALMLPPSAGLPPARAVSRRMETKVSTCTGGRSARCHPRGH